MNVKRTAKLMFQALGACILGAALIPGCGGIYTIKDYLADQAFVPVAGIAGIPDGAAMTAPLTLAPRVAPENATNKTVLWAVSDAGDTGAEISGNVFRAWAAGEAKITARIANGLARGRDFVQEFPVRVTEEFLPVTEIKRGFGPTAPSGTPLTLAGTVQPDWATNWTIGWSLVAGGTTNASLAGNVLTIPDGGDVTVRATVVNGKSQYPSPEDFTQDFTITVLKTATPAVSEPSVVKGVDAVLADAPFTLTNNPPFVYGTVWRVYGEASGGDPLEGVGVSASGSALTLSHASDVPAGTYYVSAAEPGKGESNRAALTIIGVYSITYHLEGGAMEGYTEGETLVTYRTDELPYTLPVPLPPDRVFMGWYEDEPCEGAEVAAIPPGSAGPREFWTWWSQILPVVNVASPGASGPRWSYANSTITIQTGANLTLTGGPTSNSVVVAPDAAARLTLNNMTLGNPLVYFSYFRSINASQAAQVTLLLEGTSTAGGNDDATSVSALLAAPVTVIDSAASGNAGDLAASSRSTEGTFLARGSGFLWYDGLHDPSIQGSVTVLGGVLIARNDDGYGNNDITGTLTAMGGVTIAPHAINSLVYPEGSTAVVFVRNVPSGWYENNHSDLVVCGSEASISGNTITLNERLRIPAGVALRIPAGWTLVTGGHLINDGIIINDGTITGDIDGTGTLTNNGTHTGSLTGETGDDYHILTINYHLNGGVLNGESGEVTEFRDYNNEPYTLPRPARADHIFLGWFDNEGLSGNFVTTVPAGSSGTKDYYAKWGLQGSAVDIGMSAASSGTGWSYDSAAKVITVQNNAAVTFMGITTENRIVIASNAAATVTLHDATINVSGTTNAAFDIGDGAAVILLLAGTNVLTSGGVAAGIHAPAGRALVIDSAASTGAGTASSAHATGGALTVTGSKTTGVGASAGIGGSMGEEGGVITIMGGTVTATAGTSGSNFSSGAAIGGGGDWDNAGYGNGRGNAGTIVISGGIVNALGVFTGAGIGGGCFAANTGSSITITGGTVTATGGGYGAGIGGSYGGSGGAVTISGGSGMATGGSYASSVGPGRYGSGGSFSGPNGETSWPTANPYSWGE